MGMLQAIAVQKSVPTMNGPLEILKEINLNITAGSAIAIVGASGSGKTTLLSLLAGLDLPTAGDILIEGQSLPRMGEDARARFRLGQIGFIFQNFELLPFLNALENVMLPWELCRRPDPEVRAQQLLTQVGLQQRYQHFPAQLSGGEQQRVAIARAYVTEPKILFADEPTGSLDTQTGESIINLLFTLKKQMNTTLIFVTHDPQLAKLCDQLYVLQDGKLQLMP